MRYIYTVLCIFSLIFLASCGSKVSETEVSENAQEESVVDNTAEDDLDILEDIQPEAMQVSDIMSSITSELQGDNNFRTCLQDNIDMCVRESYSLQGKEIACDAFILESNRVACESQKSLRLALDSGDISACESLGIEQQVSCKYEILVAEGIENLDISVCEQLEGYYNTECANIITTTSAVADLNESICDDIVSFNSEESGEIDISPEKEYCQQEVRFEIEAKQQEEFEEELEIQE